MRRNYTAEKFLWSLVRIVQGGHDTMKIGNNGVRKMDKFVFPLPRNAVYIRPVQDHDWSYISEYDPTVKYVVCNQTGVPLVGVEHYSEALVTIFEHGGILCTVH